MDDLQDESAAVVSDWGDYDDASLFGAIADWDKDEELASSALREIHSRYRFWVAKWSGIEFGSNPIPGMTSDDLQQEAWMKVQRNAGTFQGAGDDGGQGRTKAWLRTIIRNAHIDALRHRGRQCLCAMSVEDACSASVLVLNPDSEDLTPEQRVRTQALFECLQKLPERARTVLEASSEWLELGEDCSVCNMPKSFSEQLADDLGTTAQNIRQLRSRGFKALKKCVEEKMKNMGAKS